MKRDPLAGYTAGYTAGFISRVMAFGIDFVVICLTLLLVAAGATAVESLFAGPLYVGVRFAVTVGATVFASVFAIIYPIVFWTLFGQTPGKMLMGLRIVRTNGQPLRLGHAILRYVGWVLSAAALFLGFVWILVDKRRQGWDDKIGDTLVIYTERNPLRELTARREAEPMAQGMG